MYEKIVLTLIVLSGAFLPSFRRNRKKGLGILESLYRL